MHKMRLTDFPRFVSITEYESAIEAMAGSLAKIPGVMTIYQIGGVSHPGISDIDLYAVFEDNAYCEIDPLQNLPNGYDYLFIHHIFGASAGNFAESQRYPFFHQYRPPPRPCCSGVLLATALF